MIQNRRRACPWQDEAKRLTQHSDSSLALSSVALGDGWPNLPPKCQPNTSLRSREIKDSAVFSEEQPDVSGVARMFAVSYGKTWYKRSI
jgi:hypothetical protein